jgi:hypothetical protein
MEIFDLNYIDYKIIGSPECRCKHGIQRVDHLIFQCKMLRNEREILKNSLVKRPVSRSEITNRNLKQFIRYINSMEFEQINRSNEHM